eukprot:Em0023g104a
MVACGLKTLAFHIMMLAFASATLKWHTSERMIRTAGSSSYPAFSATEDVFKALRSESIQFITSNHLPILIHTREKSQDIVVFVRSDNTSFNVSICPPGYLDLQAIGHLPVSVVLALTQNNGAPLSDVTRERLLDIQNLSQTLLGTVGKQSFEADILTATSSFISQLLSRGMQSADTTNSFVQSLSYQLKATARQAVMTYLVYLNNTITSLLMNGSIAPAEFNSLSVAIALNPFIESQSFLEQYYIALLNLQSLPLTTQQGRVQLLYQYWNTQTCSVPSTDLINTSICTQSSATVRQNVSGIFFGTSNGSVHLLLSQAASDVICSSDLYFPSCRKVSSGLSGFDGRIQRVYVVVIIYLTTTLIVLAVVMVTLCKEGERMKMERRVELTSQVLLNAHTGSNL